MTCVLCRLIHSWCIKTKVKVQWWRNSFGELSNSIWLLTCSLHGYTVFLQPALFLLWVVVYFLCHYSSSRGAIVIVFSQHYDVFSYFRNVNCGPKIAFSALRPKSQLIVYSLKFFFFNSLFWLKVTETMTCLRNRKFT
jgi:hypothetical protein